MQTDYSIGIKSLSEINRCPVCGDYEIDETRKWGKHCSGKWNESIQFKCRAKYEFSPNFNKVGLVRECTRNPAFTARRELTEKVRQEIFALAESRGIHPDEMTKLRQNLEYWIVSTW